MLGTIPSSVSGVHLFHLKALPFQLVTGSSSDTHCKKILCLGNEDFGRPFYLEEDKSKRGFMMASLACVGVSFIDSSAYAKVKNRSPYDEKRLLEQNKKIQEANKAPDDFPNFVREGFEVKVVASDNYMKSDSGLFYIDIEVGQGDYPVDGQQVTFHYIGYNESGRRIDSTYIQGSPAKIRLGNNALVPGFEEGIKNMRPGGRRRLIIPPELGPPVYVHPPDWLSQGGEPVRVGPSTFFSAKQFEVFDVELLEVKDCKRRKIGFYSDVVCD